MDVLRASSAIVPSYIPTTIINKTQFTKPLFQNFLLKPRLNSSFTPLDRNIAKFRLFTTLSSSPASTESIEPPQPEVESDSEQEKFDWYSEWYPVMPVCDLDKRVPHAKKVLGLDLVVWWDRNENEWKVFDDTCPHRLAPLSEGRIDQWGRLQCVYHGWCFSGSGDCKFIPQAPPDGPPVFPFLIHISMFNLFFFFFLVAILMLGLLGTFWGLIFGKVEAERKFESLRNAIFVPKSILKVFLSIQISPL